MWRFWLAFPIGAALLWAFINADVAVVLPAGWWFSTPSWLFFFTWLLLPLCLGLLWRWNLRWLCGLQLSFGECVTTQGLAWGGRYLPGKAGLYVAKIGAFNFKQGTKRCLAFSVLIEQIFFVAAATSLVLLISPWGIFARVLVEGESTGWRLASFISSAWLQNGAPLIAVVLILSIVIGVAGLAKRLDIQFPTGGVGHWAGLFCGHLLLHLLLGFSLYPLIGVLLPEVASILGPLGIIVALAAAHATGILVFLAPAGLGARELALATIFAVGSDFQSALAVAVYIRFITLLADFAFFFFCWLGLALLRR